MTGLRAYTINTLCTIQVYNYLPKNKHVSDVSVYVARENLIECRKNENDVYGTSF